MRKYLPFLFLMLFSISFMIYFYHDIIFHPNNFLFSDTGDAIKNYFTYAYHIAHPGSERFNFTGMNYPFGENIFFTDCHPALLLLLKSISTPGDFISTHSIGILNTILILSVFLTFIAVYYLVKVLRMPGWLCVAAAISITVLAPQLFRLGGHLALSYSTAFPVSWLLLLLTLRTKKILIGSLLFFNVLFWLFIHAYLGIIIISFLLLVTLITFFVESNKGKMWLHYFVVVCGILLPVAIFYFTVNQTDSHVDRTDNPTGFFLYNAEPDDVFIPHHPPLKPVLDKLSGGSIKQEWEAWSYVGFTAGLVLLMVLLFSLKEVFRKNKSLVFQEFFNSKEINSALIAALLLLFFAMAFPFRQLPVLLDIFPILKQFRATGRFTWPFYFVIMIFVTHVLWILFKNADTTAMRFKWMIIVILTCIFNLLEGIPYHKDISASLIKSSNLFDRHQLTGALNDALNSIKPEEYQSILPLPFYYQGSESFSRPRKDDIVKLSIVVAYHTGLPLFSANLTRTSITESKKIVQLVSPGFYKKDIVADLNDQRPVLVVCTTDDLTRYEQNLFSSAKMVYQGPHLSLLSLEKSALFADERMKIVNEYHNRRSLLFTQDDLRFSKDSVFYFRNNFDDTKSEKFYKGNGGFQGNKKGKNVFARFPPNTFISGSTYTVRLWMYNGLQDALNDWFRLIVEEYNENQNTWKSTTFFPEQCETINGEWSMAEFDFTVEDAGNQISLVSIGKEYERQPLFVDELFIMESDADVYRFDENSGTMFYNNHTFLIPEKGGFISTP